MFGGFSGEVGVAGWAVLIAGFAYAAVVDVRIREAPDAVWLGMGLAGFLLGVIALTGGGPVGLVAWGLVGLLVVQHFLPWDVPLEKRSPALPGRIELGAYAAVGIVLGYYALTLGLGGNGLPPACLAAYVAVIAARALFEIGLLYGGADAKALIAAALLVPLAPPTLIAVPAGALRLAHVVPGPLTILMDAAVLSVAVPIGLAVRNLRAGEFEGASSFVGYRIPVAELTERFVWLRDPLFGSLTPEEEEVESSEEDAALRQRQRAQLEAQGVARVWVTPQIPFLVVFLAAAIAAALVGNLLFDLLGLL